MNPFPLPPSPTADEQALIAAAQAGDVFNHSPPSKAYPRIRAAVIEHLAMGGAKGEVHPRGVRLRGCEVRGAIDLSECAIARPLSLVDCDIDGHIDLRGATCRTLDLTGSHLRGVDDDGDSLIADQLEVRGGVFLRSQPQRKDGESDGRAFIAHGCVRLTLAKIGGSLNLQGGEFRGAPPDKGQPRVALYAPNVSVSGKLQVSRHTLFNGRVDLAGGEAQELVIGKDFLENNESRLRIDGFVYQRLGGSDRLFRFSRARRLPQGQPKPHLKEALRTQPFEQIARVLAGMGQQDTAARIGFLRETFVTRALAGRVLRWTGARRGGDAQVDGGLAQGLGRYVSMLWWLFARVLHHLTLGYGYRPYFALVWLGVIWAGGVYIHDRAWRDGAIVPNDPFILRSDDWMWCLWQEEAQTASAAQCWLSMRQPAPPTLAAMAEASTRTAFPIRGYDYPRFSAVTYALDVLIPFVDLNQETRWTPRSGRGEAFGGIFGDIPSGAVAVGYVRAQILLGWAFTALFAASATAFATRPR